jgi:hypothetical protein
MGLPNSRFRYRALAALLLCAAMFVGGIPAQAQGPVPEGVGAQQGQPAPLLRVLERTERSITFEVVATWRGRLVDAIREDLYGTVLQATGGAPWLSEALSLPAPEAPTVTVLSAESDAVPLPFDLEDEEMAPLLGPAASVERIGVERRQPTGTFTVRLLRIDPERRTLQRYHRLVVRVDFDLAARASAAAQQQNPHLGVSRSVLADGTWFKVPVTREGIYRVDRAFISRLGLNPNNIDPNQIKIFGNTGAPVPALNSAPRIADLAENPVFVVGGGSGSFGESDAVYFFGRAASGWNWDVSQSPAAWSHFINPFSIANYYFIRVDGPASRQLNTAPTPQGTPTVVSTVDGRIFIEEDLPGGMVDREGGGSGLDWLGRDLTRSRNRITVLDTLPPDLASGTVQYRSRVALRAETALPLTWLRGETAFASVTLPRHIPNSNLFTHATRTFSEPVTPSQRLRVDLRLDAGSGNPTGWIDFITAIYPQDLRASQDYLRFATPGGESGVFEFVLSGFGEEPYVWDVTRPAEVRRLPVTGSGSQFRVRLAVSDPASPREIVAFRPSSSRIRVLDGALAQPIPNQNLHGLAGHPDYVIVTPREFMPAAEELAAHRAADGLQPLVIDIAEVYNEFSGGQLDPRGLRDFLRFLYDRSPGPEPTLRYALLFGDGNYDYRGIRPMGLENNFIPTFQSDNSASYIQSYTSDDYFGLLDPDEGLWLWHGSNSDRLDIGIGRLPVRDAQEAAEMVAKIKRYEDPATFGAWRSRYTLLADDHQPQSWDRDLHVQNSEVVADTVSAHAPALNIEKIYMGSYALQQTALGARYPEATADAIRALEEGTLVWNYSGHGGPLALADERLITREQIRALGNMERLTVAVTATCSFGRYDLRDDRSGGEEFVLNPNGGAVAIFTTSRVVYASTDPGLSNLGLNTTLNRYLFARDSGGQPLRLGDIYQRTKAHDIGAQLNNRKFNLLGDPAMRFGVPARPVQITEINGVAIGGAGTQLAYGSSVSASGAYPSPSDALSTSRGEGVALSASPAMEAAGALAELRALELATIRGKVLGFGGHPDPSFSGEVEVLVYDVERITTLPPVTRPIYTDGTYRQRSDLIYRGRATVSAGQWQVEFIVPRDVSYAGQAARVAAYVVGDAVDGLGFTEDVLISRESGAPLTDNEGPRIRLFLNDTTFVSGGLAGSEPVLIARIRDESGINMAGVGVGHEMRLVINGNEAEAINVGHYYQSDLDTFRSGTLRYRLPPLADGAHTMSLTAWDVVNNSSTATLDFVVEDSDRLRIEHVYPYPNPTTGPTRFVFEHNQAPGTPATVQIRIFTLNGRPIRTLDGPETLPDGILPGSPVQIPWDGRDEDFDELATGIYLYRVRVEVDLGDGERRLAERIERLAIIR